MKIPSATTALEEPLLRPVMPELDSIRGLAILMVVAYHAFYWQIDLRRLSVPARTFALAMWTGRLGVNLFFVLSGFLITGLLLQSVQRNDYYKRFYIRRALRILPVYYALLLVLAVFRLSSSAFLGLSAIYLSNVTPLFGVVQSYPVLWSLSVEEHFYLVWPTIVRKITPPRLFACCIAIVLATPILRWISFAIDVRHGYVSYTFNDYTWNSADGLACGALLAVGLREFKWDRRLLMRFSVLAILGAAAIWIVGLPFGILSRQGTALGAALQVTPWNFAFTGFLGLCLLVGTTSLRWMVLSPVLRFFGGISYGLYLSHLLVFEVYDRTAAGFSLHLNLATGGFAALCIRFFCVLGISATLAHLSREYFEEPFLRLKDRVRVKADPEVSTPAAARVGSS